MLKVKFMQGLSYFERLIEVTSVKYPFNKN
jgi:hypothetical protein